MKEPQLTIALTRKLVFGDAEQITALKQYESILEKYFGKEGETRWSVYVEIKHSETIYVTAEKEYEAIEKAKAEFGMDLSNCKIFFTASKNKKRNQIE